MIKTIKVKKNLRLDELIKYIFDNGIKAENGWIKYRTKYDGMVTVDMSGQINVCGAHLGNEVYTVEVEEAITEDTKFIGVQEVFKFLPEETLETEVHPQRELKSIKDVLDEHDEETECLQIYAKVNGKLELIWEITYT